MDTEIRKRLGLREDSTSASVKRTKRTLERWERSTKDHVPKAPRSKKKLPEEDVRNASDVKTVTHELAAVGLTLPTYWPQNPDAWFIKVEAQFKNARITLEET